MYNTFRTQLLRHNFLDTTSLTRHNFVDTTSWTRLLGHMCTRLPDFFIPTFLIHICIYILVDYEDSGSDGMLNRLDSPFITPRSGHPYFEVSIG